MVGSGATQINLHWETRTTSNCKGALGGARKVQQGREAVRSDDASGPVEYLRLEATATVFLANPINKTFTARINATVGVGVDTTGSPAARNSGVLVGLMKRVLSFRAKGMKPASQPAR